MKRRRRLLLLAVIAMVLAASGWLYRSRLSGSPESRLSRMSVERLSAWSREHPADSAARRLLGERLLREGRTDEAVRVFAEAAEREPEAVWPLVAQSRAFLQAGRLEEALAPLETALRRNPEDADANAALGEAYYAAGRREMAETVFQAAAKSDAKNAAAQAGLAFVLADKPNLAGARDAARRAAELAPDTGLAHRALGYVEEKAGNVAEAARHLSIAVKKEPRRGQTWALLASVRVRAARTPTEFAEAGAAIDRAEALLPPNTAQPAYLRGLLLAKQRRHEEAIAAFRQALERSPGSTDALYNLAAALAFTGRKSESDAVRARFEKARDYERQMIQLRLRVAREPERADLWRRMKTLAEAHSDESSAEAASERLQALHGG